MKIKKMVALGTALTMALSLAACGGSEESGGTAAVSIPSIDSIELGSDYQDITASIKVLTNRTDVVDTVYKGYADQFMKLYPNITGCRHNFCLPKNYKSHSEKQTPLKEQNIRTTHSWPLM